MVLCFFQLSQRSFILTILLEHKMSSYLVRCVKEWADGSRGVSGCTLPNLIQWAWDCVSPIKYLTDALCKYCISQTLMGEKNLLSNLVLRPENFIASRDKCKYIPRTTSEELTLVCFELLASRCG